MPAVLLRVARLNPFSLASIAVACAATGLTSEDESRLFRLTSNTGIFLACVVGIVAMLFAYVWPALVAVLLPKG